MVVELRMRFVVDEGNSDSDGSEEGFFLERRNTVLMKILTPLSYLLGVQVHNW